MKISSGKFHVTRLEHILELAQTLNHQTNFDEILRLTASRVCQLLDAELALIMMLNPRTQETVKTIIKGGAQLSHPSYQSAQNQISGWIMKHKKPLLTPDIKRDADFGQVSWSDLHIKSVLGVPLQIEDMVIGSIILVNKKNQSEFDESDLASLDNIGVIASPYLRNTQKLQEYFQAPLPDAALLAKYEKMGLLGASEKFLELLQSIEAAARCDVRVLLEGQSGTGKELVARSIHQFSSRCEKPFIAMDCGAIPTHLLESELFGHVKGAFTGAATDRKGLLEEADQGTLFMDEIANLPLEMQAKLMRVLQEGEIRPVGSNEVRKIDVRIISASSSPIKELVQEKKFREDLYYRLYVYPIQIPSLNDRSEDIPWLADHFLSRFADQQSKQAASFEKEIVDFMQDRNWQGNIRELENFVERLVALTPEDVNTVSRKDLPPDLKDEMRNVKYAYDDSRASKSLPESVDEYEENLIRKALEEHGWNQSRAARSLKIPVQTIRYKMSKLGIEKPS